MGDSKSNYSEARLAVIVEQRGRAGGKSAALAELSSQLKDAGKVVIGTTPSDQFPTHFRPMDIKPIGVKIGDDAYCLGCGSDEFVTAGQCKKCEEEGPPVSVEDVLFTLRSW